MQILSPFTGIAVGIPRATFASLGSVCHAHGCTFSRALPFGAVVVVSGGMCKWHVHLLFQLLVKPKTIRAMQFSSEGTLAE